MFEGVSEGSGKLSLLRSLAASHDVDALLLQRVSSVAWATARAVVYVNTSHNEGEASLLITGKSNSCSRTTSKPLAWKKWKPPIPGTTSADTILVRETGIEILTATPSWPIITVDVDGVLMERPTVLVVEQ